MSRTHFIYRAWDGAGRLLYVGCTSQPKVRHGNHRLSSAWYPYATRFEMSGPYEMGKALDMERAEIVEREPIFNWQPKHTGPAKRRQRRLRELTEQIQGERGLDFSRDFSDKPDEFRSIRDEVEARVDAEFDVRCTARGRLAYYLSLVEDDKAVAA